MIYKGAVADPNRIAEWTSDGTPHKLVAGLFSAGTDYYLKRKQGEPPDIEAQ